jgi:hypothetical protein
MNTYGGMVVSTMAAILLGVLSVAVGATEIKPKDGVDVTFDQAIVRCERLGYATGSLEYRGCVREQLRLLSQNTEVIADSKKTVGVTYPSCFPPASVAAIFTVGDESLIDLCREHIRPLRPCPPNRRLYWDNCRGSFTFYKEQPIGQYEGEWRLNRRHGEGILIAPTGDRSEGRFFLGRVHGRGKLTFADGTQYAGDFLDDNRTGTATQTYKSGDKYTGTFYRGERHGTGVLVYADGRVYQGAFTKDKLNGNGKLALTNGDYYEGQFSDNTITGIGTLTYSNGQKYVGQWRKNLQHGKGILYGLDGSVLLEGSWSDGNYLKSSGK